MQKYYKKHGVRGFLISLVSGALVLTLLVQGFAQKTGAQSTNSKTSIPKKIFAGELAKSLKLKEVATKKCYTDLDKKDKNTSAICTLKKAKIFGGKTNAKFAPNSKTTFSFAVQSLCRAHKWTKTKSLKSCKKYAKKRGFTETPRFITADQLPRLLSLKTQPVLAEPILSGTSSEPTDTREDTRPATAFSTTIPPRETVQIKATPVSESTITPDFFANIVLSGPLPTRFYLDEVYFIEGTVSNISTKDVLVFLCAEGEGCDNPKNFLGKTDESGHFKIPVHFKEVGNFEIGIIPGRAGQSHVENISVLPENPNEPTGGSVPTDFSVTYSNGKTTFTWNSMASLTRITIFQDQNRKDYLFRQSVQSYTPFPGDFSRFKKGKAGFFITQDSAQSALREIELTTHELRTLDTAGVEIKALQETFAEPSRFIFRAKALTIIDKKAAVTLPSGEVRELIFSENDISKNQEFTIESDLSSIGTYIFEVNTPEGNAVVNVPIYIGAGIPLLPDFFALNPGKLDTTPIADLNQAKQQLLALINRDRASMKLPPVTLSNELNPIAQTHSQDMIERNFFGHVNPSGLSPDDRRKNANISTPIRENLGKSPSLELIEVGLMRSPIHRATIIEPTMTRVGLGIAKNTQGYFFVTQNFSADPLSASDLPFIEEDLVNTANAKRASKGLQALSKDQKLKDIALFWSSRMAQENFFGATDPQGKSLANEIRSQGITSSIQLYVVQAVEKSQLEEELLEEIAIQDSTLGKVGIGLGLNSIGELFMTVIYTP